MHSTDSRLRSPVQDRSRRTLERFVQAAHKLLESHNWEEITLAQLARKAGSSIGAFYTRFQDKDALLDHLDELYARDFIAVFGDFAPEEHGARTLPDKIELIVTTLGRFYRKRAGVARALVLRARLLREPGYDERTSRMNDALASVYRSFRSHEAEIAHADTERAVFFAFNLAFFPLRERILFPETIQDRDGHGDADLERELSRAVLSYLCPRARLQEKTP